MKTKRVNRYYCDHCAKGGLSSYHMRRHEERCIKNPNRLCGFCASDGEPTPKMQSLRQAFADGGLDALRQAAHHCPGCMLAAIVQSRTDDDPYPCPEFNYKEAKADYWKLREPETGPNGEPLF